MSNVSKNSDITFYERLESGVSIISVCASRVCENMRDWRLNCFIFFCRAEFGVLSTNGGNR